MIHPSSHSCSFYSDMTYSLHWISTQVHILLTTVKRPEAKLYSYSLATPNVALFVITAALSHNLTLLYFITLHATLCYPPCCDRLTYSLHFWLGHAAFWFIRTNYFCTTRHLRPLLSSPCLFTSVLFSPPGPHCPSKS